MDPNSTAFLPFNQTEARTVKREVMGGGVGAVLLLLLATESGAVCDTADPVRSNLHAVCPPFCVDNGGCFPAPAAYPDCLRCRLYSTLGEARPTTAPTPRTAPAAPAPASLPPTDPDSHSALSYSSSSDGCDLTTPCGQILFSVTIVFFIGMVVLVLVIWCVRMSMIKRAMEQQQQEMVMMQQMQPGMTAHVMVQPGTKQVAPSAAPVKTKKTGKKGGKSKPGPAPYPTQSPA